MLGFQKKTCRVADYCMMVVGWAVGALGLGGSHWISVDCSYARVDWTALVIGGSWWVFANCMVGVWSWRHLGWRGEGAAWGVCVIVWGSLRGELARWRSFGGWVTDGQRLSCYIFFFFFYRFLLHSFCYFD